MPLSSNLNIRVLEILDWHGRHSFTDLFRADLCNHVNDEEPFSPINQTKQELKRVSLRDFNHVTIEGIRKDELLRQAFSVSTPPLSLA